jgi:hypothetical protein
MIKMTKIDNTKANVVGFYAISVLVTLGIVAYMYISSNAVSGYRVKAVQSSNGYGYEIYFDGKKVIEQPFIPGQGGFKTFETSQMAEKAGAMAVEKLKMGQLPVLTKDELIEIGVLDAQ